MLLNKYSELAQADKLILFEAAVNSSLNQLFTKEKEDIELQILKLELREGETDSGFRRRFDNLKTRLNFLNEFFEIQERVMNDIKQMRGE